MAQSDSGGALSVSRFADLLCECWRVLKLAERVRFLVMFLIVFQNPKHSIYGVFTCIYHKD